MSNDDIREAANRAVDKLTELQTKMWQSMAEAAGGSPHAEAEQKALISEYDAAIADIDAFRRAFSGE